MELQNRHFTDIKKIMDCNKNKTKKLYNLCLIFFLITPSHTFNKSS